MRNAARAGRGQVLIIFVFAILGLIGITGIAIDGSNIYSDRRHAQNAADAASLAGAVVRLNMERSGKAESDCINLTGPGPCGPAVLTAAKNRASDNGYTGNIIDSKVDVYTPPVEGPYTGNTEYIQVIINTNVNTWFAKVLGIQQLHNHVQATALARYEAPHPFMGGYSLMELKPTGDSAGCSGEFTLTGSAKLELTGGGIYVNSNNSTCAFKETSGCVDIWYNGVKVDSTTNPSPITGIGGQKTTSCLTAPTLQYKPPQYAYPPEGPFGANWTGPKQCSWTPQPSQLLGDGFTRYYPGHYDMLPPDKNTELSPGVYCVDNVIKTTNPTTLRAKGVFIYIKPGGTFNFQGGVINLSAPGSPGAGTPDADTSPYAGYLFYVDESPTNWFGTAPNCIINGSSEDTFTGVIYAPHCDVTINGGSGPNGIQAAIIGYTLMINGDTYLKFDYGQTPHPLTPEINYTGLYH